MKEHLFTTTANKQLYKYLIWCLWHFDVSENE